MGHSARARTRDRVEQAFLDEVGAQIREVREGQKLTRSQLAARAGLSFWTVDGLEKGAGSSLSTLWRACDALELEPFIELEPR